MKKFLVLSLCAVLTGGFLAGCGSTNEKATDKSESVVEEKEEEKVASAINIAELDIKGLTETEFKESAKLSEITKEVEGHYARILAGNEAMGDTFENSSTGTYDTGVLDDEKIFVVNFTNKSEESSLDTIATEFGVNKESETFGSKVVMKLNIKKDTGLIISDEELNVIKEIFPELEKEDVKKHLTGVITDAQEGGTGSYSYDYKVDAPGALFIDTIVPEGQVDDLVVNITFWSNYDYV